MASPISPALLKTIELKNIKIANAMLNTIKTTVNTNIITSPVLTVQCVQSVQCHKYRYSQILQVLSAETYDYSLPKKMYRESR